jgi:uncharacterized protein YecT (DUF1311 family)
MPIQNRRLWWGKLFIVKLQFQKRSALELVSRIPPLAGQSGGYDTPQRTRELFSRISLGFMPVIIIVLFGLLSTQALAASFDCKKAATWLEKTVCSNPELSKLDDELAKAYHDALSSLSPEGQKETKQYQKQWLKNLSPFCKVRAKFEFDDSTAECLKVVYKKRITQLQQILIKLSDRIFRNVHVSHSKIDQSCEGNVYVNVEFMYPQIENPRDENEKLWNNLVSQKANDWIKIMKKGSCGYTNRLFTVSFSKRHLISYMDGRSLRDNEASPGLQSIQFSNWLLEDKRELKASDLFDNKTDWRNKLAALVVQKKKEQEAADGSSYAIPGQDFKSKLINIDKLISSDNWWMISKDGLVFGLDAWNSSHSVLFTIDWKTLDHYLSKNGHSLIYD